MRRNSVIGQTGSVVLSDNSRRRQATKSRTVRYSVVRKSARRFELSVCSPPCSRMLGLTVYGSTLELSVMRLKVLLANDYRYFGRLICTPYKKPKVTRADVERAGGYREYARDVVHGPIIT